MPYVAFGTRGASLAESEGSQRRCRRASRACLGDAVFAAEPVSVGAERGRRAGDPGRSGANQLWADAVAVPHRPASLDDLDGASPSRRLSIKSDASLSTRNVSEGSAASLVQGHGTAGIRSVALAEGVGCPVGRDASAELGLKRVVVISTGLGEMRRALTVSVEEGRQFCSWARSTPVRGGV